MADKRIKGRNIQAPAVDWLSKLSDELKIKDVPDGWYTCPEIAESLGVSLNTVLRMIRAGQYQKQKFRARNGKITDHYRPL